MLPTGTTASVVSSLPMLPKVCMLSIFSGPAANSGRPVTMVFSASSATMAWKARRGRWELIDNGEVDGKILLIISDNVA